MESYMTVTAHFIDEDWKAKSLVLETKQIEEAHTGTNIAVRLSEVADAFKVIAENKVSWLIRNSVWNTK